MCRVVRFVGLGGVWVMVGVVGWDSVNGRVWFGLCGVVVVIVWVVGI